MGVKNLWPWIAKVAPQCVTAAPLATLRGRVIAIDIAVCIYEWISAGQRLHIVNSRGVQINHIQGLLYRGLSLHKQGIGTIWVFDGPSRVEKRATISQRAAARDRVRLPHGVVAECKELLQLLGWRWTVAPHDAEAVCAALTRAPHNCFGVATEDSDGLLFGARNVLRKVRAAGTTYTQYNRQLLLQSLHLSGHQFTLMCVLAGTDYAPGSHSLSAAYHVAAATTNMAAATDPNVATLEHIIGDCRVGRVYTQKKPQIRKLTALLTRHDLLPVKITNAIAALNI